MKYKESDWENIQEGNLVIRNQFQYFHNHAKEILEYNKDFLNSFKDALSNKIPIDTILRKKKNPFGIGATPLNKELRKLLKNKFPKLKFEVNEQNGVYYFSSDDEKQQVAGFDFALLNSKNNLIKLRNLCFGELKYSDGKKDGKNLLLKM